MKSDFYQILRIDRSAGIDDIKRAYRELARRFHPDVSGNPETEETFKQINEAYSVLSDDQSRRMYDLYGTVTPGRRPGNTGPAAASPGFGRGRRGGGCFGRRCGGRGIWSAVFQQAGRMQFQDADSLVYRLTLTPDEMKQGVVRMIRLRDESGSFSLQVTIPANVQPGQRIRIGRRGRGLGPEVYLQVCES